MKIAQISLGIIDIPLLTPFKTALRKVDSIHDLVVKVETEDGTHGYGEAPPTAVITGETVASMRAAISDYIAPSIVGMDVTDLDAILEKLASCMAKNTSAKAAVDMALYDLVGRLNGTPLFRLLAKDRPEQIHTNLQTDLTISLNETDEMVFDSLVAVERGFRSLKVKVGRGGACDVDRVKAIRSAVGPDIHLLVDANQGWTRQEAIRTIGLMEDAGLRVELVEQPVSCHDFDSLQAVTQAVHTPILADESVFSVEDARRIITEHAADMINIKLMKTGGIYQALKICDLAEHHGVSCMIGCMLESKVSVSAAAHLAGARSCITVADLDGPSLCSQDPYLGGPTFLQSNIFLPETPGIGIESIPTRWEALGSKDEKH